MGSTVTRRTLLGGAAAAATAVVTAPSAMAAAPPLTEDRRRAVVIGSGFGGGVTAMRLAQAGVPVLVLERGRRWVTGPNANTFPTFLNADRRSSWMSYGPVYTGAIPGFFQPYTGLIERVKGRGMDIVCGAAVGGGSLVYHGATIEPSEAVISPTLPSIDFGEMKADHFRRVAARLQIAGVPDDVLAAKPYRHSRHFLKRVEAVGNSSFRVPLALDWEYVRRELRGEMKPVYTTNDVLYGANNGGRHTIDLTYLAAAEATGRAEVAQLHWVRDISRDTSGRWVVRVDRINTDGTVLERKRITTDALFLSAGSAGTTRLMVKAKAKGLIGDLPDGVGRNWGNNGDRVFTWTIAGAEFSQPQGGPVCAGTQEWSDPAKALTVIQSAQPVPLDLHTTTIIGLGVTKALGTWSYDQFADDAVLTWDQAYDRDLTRRITARVNAIAGPDAVLADLTGLVPETYHPLGGATIGSVCDTAGRVKGQRGLYVVDGALIPGSSGACNPSMTITALAERALDRIVATDVGKVF